MVGSTHNRTKAATEKEHLVREVHEVEARKLFLAQLASCYPPLKYVFASTRASTATATNRYRIRLIVCDSMRETEILELLLASTCTYLRAYEEMGLIVSTREDRSVPGALNRAAEIELRQSA